MSDSSGSFFRSGPARWVALATLVIIAGLLAWALIPRATQLSSAPATPPASASPGSATPTASASVTPAPTAPAKPTPAPSSSTNGILRAAPPVAITARPHPVTGLTVHITKMRAVDGTAQGPGEVAGAAVQVTLAVANGTAKTISLASTIVNAYYGAANTPASPLSGPGAVPLAASVKAGATITAVYVFSVPVDSRAEFSVTFDYSAKVPVIVLRGPAPK
ncbi:hypothetical protein [Galbitalea soli]|uniref:DUF4352 domain-containing protein n=1 Tax=Galbitalea soli TaxID=1268042 RepID=A0A7C9TN22_9MICO|nr:hypothetical protein [Galbitalea soli]NEM89978.1 hypothetical protein [Galbitalea soli]NYJ30685.1 hypothetical protein [Galbitalea soli]